MKTIRDESAAVGFIFSTGRGCRDVGLISPTLPGEGAAVRKSAACSVLAEVKQIGGF